MNITQNDINRFYTKFKIEQDTNCWIFTGAEISPNGYGTFWYDNQNISAHRFSYIIHNGFALIPNNLLVCHKSQQVEIL